MKKRKAFIAILLCFSLSFAACGDGNADSDGDGINAVTDEDGNIKYTDSDGNTLEVVYGAIDELGADDLFSKRDFKTEYDDGEAVHIALADGASSADGGSVEINGDVVTITDEGVYVISGTLSNGSIVVNAEKSDKLMLVLDGVNVEAVGTAALYVMSADKVFVMLADGSENTLSSVGDFEETDEGVDAAVYSKDDVTFNGTGALTVVSECGHGIVSKDDAKFTGGKYTVTASKHAISANDRVCIADGEYILTSGKDGIHSENKKDTSLGLVYVSGGSLNIKSDGDGIDASASVQIDGGELDFVTGGGNENGRTHTDNMGFGGMGGFGGFGGNSGTSSADETVSTKGIKSDAALVVNGGNFDLDCADDALHSAGKLTVTGGTLEIKTGDDGLHSDTDLIISGGTVNVSVSYEGIEGVTVTVAGGEINVCASDDGINAAGGSDSSNGGFGGMMGGSDEYSLNILGGKIYVSADGDGVDSNGSFNVAGGEIYIDGPTNSANGALDYETSATVTGGICVAVGAVGMAESFTSATQGAIMINATGSAGTEITVKDSYGDVILSYTPKKSFSSVVLTAPEIGNSGEYTITVGSDSTTVKMDGYLYGSSGGFGGFGGMGGFGGFGGGNKPGGDPGGDKPGGGQLGGRR